MSSLIKAGAVVVLLVMSCAGVAKPANDQETTPSLEIGARVFKESCMLCHGSQGMGEGNLPMKIKAYPDTNLLLRPRFTTREQVHDLVTHGLTLDGVSKYRPPMGQELTWTELESVVNFVMALREDKAAGIALLDEVSLESLKPSLQVGRTIFEARCALCHGTTGAGDGRMARIIKDPPPFNLQKSVMPAEYLRLIIAEGGEAVGRSGQMPPWGQQLTEAELISVVDYIVTLRDYR